jgi:catechol 2,3-dioxygenase-like lactoylglutathione lyase family enzyme
MCVSNVEAVLHLKHLALAAQDVRASSRFYAAYFGFHEGPGLGLMANADGFLLAIHQAAEPVKLPDLLHFGFHFTTRDEVWSLYERMKQDGVTLQGEPAEHRGDLAFWCRDPDGYLVEVRAINHQAHGTP